jgi:SOS-response transcriptional repressor LexA
VTVDTQAEPIDGDLVVVEAEIDGDSQRLARRYEAAGDEVRLEADNDVLMLPREAVIVLGVIVGRLRFDAAHQPTEEPL